MQSDNEIKAKLDEAFEKVWRETPPRIFSRVRRPGFAEEVIVIPVAGCSFITCTRCLN